MIAVRKALLQDLNSLSVLFDKYRMFYGKPSDVSGAKQFLKERIVKNESVIFVARNDQNIITGFEQLYPLFSSTRMKRLWLLNDLYVDEMYRGQGISVALINKAKEHCSTTNACGLTLETAKANLIGNKLFPATGFTLDSEHNFYFWDVL